ncbi:flagellar hook-basal body complex protein [Gracilibacillus salitolerans]|uniref:Flagellar hook-basal body complex protein n=1 Tax=Gracilibacillus salitolerans TaxID=2663022 RepID=A0A5Q2TNM6_9BACI|nr:flagellar hook-basal body protein [Gracilibacillus salitolerans]QGH36325.1 flagellar hook-basal body complex protein [Gracilibacillus salitolerans]
MTRMTFQAAVTMGQLQKRLDNIGNNIANVNTAGYKNRDATFSSLLSQQINTEPDPTNPEGRLTPDGLRVGTGAKLGHTNFNFSQGSLQETDRNLDVALLEDNHLFQVAVNENGEEEVRYTRAGNFYLTPLEDEQVMLVNSDGHPVLGAGGAPIVLDDDMEDLKIERNGTINVTRNGVQAVEGQLEIVEAVRPRLLEAAGNSLFRLSEQSLENYPFEEIINGVELADVSMESGSLEASNVDLAKQTTEMIETQRAYQFNARTISMHDQMKGLINQLR